MDLDFQLLKLLNRPGTHTGDRLGQELGISRVAVQKRLAGLRRDGLPLEAVAGSGYQLKPGVILLDEERLLSFLDKHQREKLASINIARELDSTNQWMQQQELVEDKAMICLAESQSAGRGRRGNSWVSVPYRNLMFSLGWRFRRWPPSLPGMSLIAGLVTCQVLEMLGISNTRIKWPNDIYLEDRKLGGILVQAGGEASGFCDLVIGLGLNLYLDAAAIKAIDQPCIDLQHLEMMLDRNQLAALLIQGFLEILPLFGEQGFAPFKKAWSERALYLGERVSVGQGCDKQCGLFKGVDDQGAVIFISDNGDEQFFTEANISLRPA